MKRGWYWVLLFSLCGGCSAAILPILPPNWTPLVATEASVVTMTEREVPQIEPDDLGQPAGGPFDSIHDAKELIRKGNELADRGKALLDQAERDGKITVDIRLPNQGAKYETSAAETACTGNGSTSSGRTVRYSIRRPLLFWRWRR